MLNSFQWIIRAIRTSSIALLVLQPSIEVLANNDLRPAVAAVTSHRKKVQHYGQDGKYRKVHTRSILPIDQTFFGTKQNGALFLSLSNGVGLGLGQSTHIWMDRYEQSTINPLHEGLDYEGSISKLEIRVESGTLALAIQHLNPLSSAEIEIPVGRVRVHTGQILIEVQTDATCRISAYNGNATFYDKDTEERTFISEGVGIVVTSDSVKNEKIDANISLEPKPEDWPNLIQATEYSRKRVVFRHNPHGQQPLYNWILPSEQFERPPARPYQFQLR